MLLPPRSALGAVPRRLAPPASPRPPRPPTRGRVACARGRASVARLSAIHFQGCSIRQVSHNTLLGGCRRSWPPSCCRDGATPFVGSVSVHSGTLARRSVHPASPVLLTKNGPLGTPPFAAARHPSTGGLAHLKFESRPRLLQPRGLQSFALPGKTGAAGSSYPEGNFGGNQLLDGSISLSPLCPGLTIDLHVRTAAGLHRGFPRLRPAQA